MDAHQAMPPPPDRLVCFRCQAPLAQTEREGVEFDYCPVCLSTWLDRGELEKLVNRLGEWNPEPVDGHGPAFDKASTAALGADSRLAALFDLR